MKSRQLYVLVCFAFCSTPLRSCSEEHFHLSTTLAANNAETSVAATSPVDTSGKHPPAADQVEAGVRKGVTGSHLVAEVEKDEKRVCRTLTSSEHVATTYPHNFLPAPVAMATSTGRRKGRAMSESGHAQGETSWLDSNLPAT